MSKVDLKKDLKHLYNPSAKEASVLEVGPMNFLMIDGSGAPNTSQEYAKQFKLCMPCLAHENSWSRRAGLKLKTVLRQPVQE